MLGKINDWNLGDKLVVYTSKVNDLYDDSRGWLIINGNTIELYEKDHKNIFLEGNVDFSNIPDRMILSISSNGIVYTLHCMDEPEIDFFVTNKCNSNCVMCPLAEGVRRQERLGQSVWVMEYIEVLSDDVMYINVTGGEPTLAKRDFLEIMKRAKEKFQLASFQVLTNGRSSSDIRFLREMLSVTPKGTTFAIPLHSSDSHIHDAITRAEGSFEQTDRGIKNLLMAEQKVEVRIVVSKENIESIYDTVKYIVASYKGVFCVNFIGMEMMGNAAINRESLWIDYDEVFRRAKGSIDYLICHGIDTQLYNFPLCALDKGYWSIAAKSITISKIRYMHECEKCAVKSICGGFFFSTKNLMKPSVRPIME